jgi:protein-disulfide isomerase
VDINIASMIAGTPILEASETERLPNVTGHPRLGSGRVHVAIFEDLACPVCAAFYGSVMPALVKLAENNTITLHFMDLIVHRVDNVTKAHEILLCLYRKTGNGTLYCHLVSEAYRVLRLYSERGGAGYTSWLGEFAANITRRYDITLSGCPNAIRDVEKSTMEAVHIGVLGTPGFVFWKDGFKYGIVVQGYHGIDFIREIIDWLAKR